MYAYIKISMNIFSIQDSNSFSSNEEVYFRCDITGCDITANCSLLKHNYKEYSFAVTTKQTLSNILVVRALNCQSRGPRLNSQTAKKKEGKKTILINPKNMQ